MIQPHRTGQGGWERRRQPPSLLLFNFDIDADALKHEHRVGLLSDVVPKLKAARKIKAAIVAIGDNRIRRRYAAMLRQEGIDLVSAIHQSAII